MHLISAFVIACAALASFSRADAQGNGPPSDSNAVTLSDVLARVRNGHPLSQAATARIDAAHGSRETAGAFTNPMVQYMVDDTPLPGRGPIPMDREAMTSAMIPLEPLYQRGPRIARADADVRAARADARTQAIELALDAAHAYYRVAIAQVSVGAMRDLSAWLDSVVTYNRARVKEGIAAEADLIRAQLEQDRAAVELSMQEADLARERATLASYLGSPSASTPLIVAVGDRPLPWHFAELAVELSHDRGNSTALLDRTPRIQAARERVGSATAGVSVERRTVIRDFSATLGTKQSAGFTSLIAGLTVPLPLFTQNRGEIARATAEQHVAEFELLSAHRTASAELVGAYDAAKILLDRATLLTARQPGSPASAPAMLARADESRRIALGAYREGAVPLLSVLDAARAGGEVRIAFYRALFAQHESVLALAAALGLDPEQVLLSPSPVLQVPR
ncbi:MAG: metal ion efflux outer rane factor protein family [Gemmatimonadetes bacterium]|nr:metal ion efflux outer rane factor protein family [Gemmatimonadota bacterium]